MWVSKLPPAGKQLEAMVDKAKATGISWICVLLGWYPTESKDSYPNGTRNHSRIEAARDRFHAAGIEVWAWGWPSPKWATPFLVNVVQKAQAIGLDGVILDPESDYYGKATEAADLMKRARKSAPKLAIGVSSYGAPWYHGSFPFTTFAQYADFGVPQVYDLNDKMGPEYQKKGVEAWQALGFTKVIPSLTTAKSSAAELEQEWGQTPMPLGAVIVWEWSRTQPGEWAQLAKLKASQGKDPDSPGGKGNGPLAVVALAILGSMMNGD